MMGIKIPELYLRVYKSLENIAQKYPSGEIPWRESVKIFEYTPGLNFGYGSSWNEILNCMVKWGWLERYSNDRNIFIRVKGIEG